MKLKGISMQEQSEKRLIKIKEKVEILKEYGGFKLIGRIIRRSGELDPQDEARRNAFLSDDDKKEKREKLKNELSLFKEIITQSEDANEIIAKYREKKEQATKVLKENLKEVFANTKQLEKAYRTLDLFFKNADEENIGNLYIINVPIEEFRSTNSTLLYESLEQHFKAKYDHFSLVDNYSFMVIPGYLGDRLHFWSKLAHQYKITLVTDYKDEKDLESVVKSINKKKLKDIDEYLSNTIVTCNYGLVRKKLDGVEDDDLYITLMEKKNGQMND